MTKSSRWHLKSIAGKIFAGLVLTATMNAINVVPSYGGDDYYRGGRGDNDRYEHRKRWHGHEGRYKHGRWHDRGRYRYYDDGYREVIYFDDRYRERVYVPRQVYVAPRPVYVEPVPVYVEPVPSPGLSIFFSTRN